MYKNWETDFSADFHKMVRALSGQGSRPLKSFGRLTADPENRFLVIFEFFLDRENHWTECSENLHSDRDANPPVVVGRDDLLKFNP